MKKSRDLAGNCARHTNRHKTPFISGKHPGTHDLRRGSRGHLANRTLACISRTRHARSPQRVARAPGTSHSRLHFAHSTRAISAEGRAAQPDKIALSPAFRALDARDLRRGLPNALLQIALSPAFRALDTHDLRRGSGRQLFQAHKTSHKCQIRKTPWHGVTKQPPGFSGRTLRTE